MTEVQTIDLPLVTSQCANPGCRARPMHDSAYCFFHDPSKAEERKACSRKGGKAKITETGDWRRVNIDSLEDLRRLLNAAMNEVASGRMHPKVGNALASLGSIMLRTIEASELEKRLDTLEAKLEEVKP